MGAGTGPGRRLGEWMRGRNGTDELASAVVAVAAALAVANLLAHRAWLGWLALALLAYAVWRVTSRAVARRQAENEAFLGLVAPLRRRLGRVARDPAAAAREARDYRHLACPSCGQRVRVPRGKGRVRVRCPRCGTSFESRT